MKSCDRLEVLLSEYADGSADPRTRRIVERHVQMCDRCRLRLEQAARVGRQLQRLTLLPPGIATRAPRLRRRLEARGLHARHARRRRLSLATALLLIALVGSLSLLYVLH
ncbi:anti-sigma factor family protein [Kallotenue papyrolyticum]|uniref:anti-sigma factor family protein n=1 Tax=Kallotenue papyrolyticum TaxID=1325125 RepID=UPI0004B984F6|nr:zf-HC2 domain-containing protein [Kallotenue papyrolyticum]